MTVLAQHSWPGNARELQNLIERSVILSTGTVLTGSLPDPSHTTHEASRWSKASTPITLEQIERLHILQVLGQTRNVVGAPNGAAARLGVPRTTLIYRDHRGCPARKRGTGLRTFRRGNQAWYSRFYPGLKDQVAQDRQESIQINRPPHRTHLNTFLRTPESTDTSPRKFPKLRNYALY
jgi:Bacterial regulatory protein, Fis family